MAESTGISVTKRRAKRAGMTPEELRDWRESHELTRAQLARLLNEMPERTLESWEQGKGVIPVFLPLALETVERRLKKMKQAQSK